MAIKFSQFNLRTDHTSGMYLVGYDGNQNIHITVDNLFDDFINGTENTIAMFGTDGTELADSILSQDAGATLLTIAGQLNVDAAATFDTSITVTGDSTLNGNVTLGDASTDLITQTGTLYLNGPVKDTTDTLGAVDQVLLSDATGELTFTDLADLHVGGAEVVEVPVKNVQGSALVKGDPVYISGSVGASGRLEVQLADASNALKMPAVGLLKQDLANNAEGFAVVTGKLRNLITDPIDGVNPTENDVVYVKPSGTSGAALTTTKPVYGNFIQNIGKVGRVSTSNDGNLVVSSILRTNDIPNLTPGRLWIGSTGNTIESQTLFVDEANSRLGIGTASPVTTLHIADTITPTIRIEDTTNNKHLQLFTDNNSAYMRSSTDTPIYFQTDGANTRMVIENSSGDVGIGTSTPSNRLQVEDDHTQVALFRSTDTEKAQIHVQNSAAANKDAYFGITTPTSTGHPRVYLGPSNNPGSRDTLKLQKHTTLTYPDTHMNLGGTSVGDGSKVSFNSRWNTADDATFSTLSLFGTLDGTDALTGDRTVSGLNVDIDSTATGGNTTQELTIKGINVDVNNKIDGDANHLYGVFASAKNTRTGAGDNMTSITGGYFQAYSSAQSGQVSNMYGVEAITYIEDATHTVNNAYAVYGRTTIDNSFDDTISTRIVGGYFVSQVESGNDSQVPQSVGVFAENEVASNIDNIKGVEIIADINGGTTTSSYLIRGSTQIAGSAAITNNWGLYLDGIDKNYLQGTLRLPAYGQGNVTGTATKNLAVDSNGNVIETDAVPANIVETITTTDGTYINLTPNSATDGAVTITADLSATGAPDATKYLRGDNTWAAISGIYDWNISDGTNSETIASGDTVIFSGDTYITTSYAAGTNTLSIDHDATNRTDTTSADTPGYGGTFTVVDSVTTNATGHLEAINVKTVTMPSADDTNTTYDLSGYGTFNGSAGVQLVGSDATTDQVAITGAGTTTVTHSGNTITVTSNDQYTGTVTGSGTASTTGGQIPYWNATTNITGTSELNYSTVAGGSIGVVGIGNNSTAFGNSRLVVGSGSGGSLVTLYGGGSNTNTIAFANGTSGNAQYRGQVRYNLQNDNLEFLTNGETFSRVYVDSAFDLNLVERSLNFRNSWPYAVGAYIDIPSNNQLSIGTNGSEKMRIDSSGNVGIGTTSPGAKLAVDSGSNGVAGYINVDSQNFNRLKIGYSFTDAPSGIGAAQIFVDSSGNLDISSRGDNASNIQFYTSSGTSPSEVMRITSSGDVGIGTTSPNSKLHIRGDNPVIHINDSNSTTRYACLAFSTAGGFWNISSGDSTAGASSNLFITRADDGTANRFIFHRDSYYFGVYDNTNTIKAVIRANGNSYFNGGNVGIGTTSPSTPLEVNVTGNNTVFSLTRDTGTNGELTVDFQNADANFDSLQGGHTFQTNNTERLRIDSSGNVGIGTTSPSRNLVVQGGGSSYLSIASGATSGSHLLMGSSFDDDEAWIQYNNNTNSMNFKVNGLFDVLVLNSDGSIQQANSSATGQYAAAFGQNNTASSLDAFTTGELNTSSGRQSFTAGFDNLASGNASFAVGGGTTASGENSFAACGTTVASGISSAAFGAFSEATATNAFAINGDTTASGESSFSAGVSTNARGLASIATGQSCGTSVSANGAFAGGTVSNANAQFSIAYGDVANASGRASQALGYIVNATGQYSFAQGFNNTASGTAAAVFGQQNTVSGTQSIASGFLNYERNIASATFGSFNGNVPSATTSNQFMLGRYLNVPRNSSGSPSVGCVVVGEHNAYTNRNNVKFAVGTGAGVGAEADSFTVLKDGNVLMEQVVNKNYSSDSAAASGGVPVGGVYHNAGDLKIRLT